MMKIKKIEDKIITAKEAYKIMDGARKKKCVKQFEKCMEDILKFAKDGRCAICFIDIYKETAESLKNFGYRVTYNKEFHCYDVSWDKSDGESTDEEN